MYQKIFIDLLQMQDIFIPASDVIQNHRTGQFDLALE